ncbi:uncharacterized protein [Parasteatoda tepidariorum]|uniref:uncharacterized protein n=1 Tax=Parasteatoda tepidariorum TaxID=114398 RepID=UPI001C72315A|nr:uncharacterized protein LOC107438171 [Parasteatoda tepidariorum]
MKMESEEHEVWGDERLEILKDGDYTPTPDGDISKQEMPSWFDSEKFNRAKKVYKEQFASINFSHLCGLLLSFYFTKNIKTLRSTGESDTKLSLFHRYLQTVRHIQKWYEGNVFDINDPAQRSLSIVRNMHARVGKKMSALNDGIVYVSQWDMAVTQWAFVGPMVLFRSRVGIHGCSEEDYDALIHFWRAIGFLLGIEDQFNLCHGDYPQVVSACKSLLTKEYKVRVADASPVSVNMGKSVVAAMSEMQEALTWNSISTYIHELVGLPCPDSMGFIDYVCHYLTKFIMLFALRNSTFRQLFNDFSRWKLDVADKKDIKFMSMLQANKSGG